MTRPHWQPNRRQLRVALGALFAIALAFVGVECLKNALANVASVHNEFAWDLAVDHQTAVGYKTGVNPFTEEGAVRLGLRQKFGHSGSGHPPTTSFWTLPLTSLTLTEANVAWAALTVVILLLELVGIFLEFGWPHPLGGAAVVLAFLLSWSALRYHLRLGQFSAAIGFLYFVSWRAGRRGNQWLCGVALGLACTMKLFPAVIGIFLLVTRRWRAAIAMTASYLAVAMFMTAHYGFASWRFFLEHQPPIVQSWLGSIQNQSIHGIVLHFFRPVCTAFSAPLTAATWIAMAISLSALGMATWFARGQSTAKRSNFDLTFSLFAALSVVTSQWAWEHYVVIYLVPFLVLVDNLFATYRRGDLVRAGATALVLVGIVWAWQVDVMTKVVLRNEVLSGHTEQHFKLHVYDAINWLPGVVVCALLFLHVNRSRESGKP